MGKYAFDFDYGHLRDMDIFVSNDIVNPAGVVIRVENAGWDHAFDRDIPNHTGFLTSDRSNFFATEQTNRGLQVNSLEKYRMNNRQIIRVWRWKGFDNDLVREDAMNYLAYLRRKRKEYDWFTLFTYPKILRWLRFGKKDDDSTEICSENIFRVLMKYGDKHFQDLLLDFGKEQFKMNWLNFPPAPYHEDMFYKECVNQFTPVEFKLVKK